MRYGMSVAGAGRPEMMLIGWISLLVMITQTSDMITHAPRRAAWRAMSTAKVSAANCSRAVTVYMKLS